jgi:hypothetical protein
LAIFQWILIGWLGGNSANEFLKSLRRKILRF